jgi:hypothetical protein
LDRGGGGLIGGSDQIGRRQPDQHNGGVIGAAAWICARAIDHCGRGVRARHGDGRDIDDDGGGAVWEAGAGGDQPRMTHTRGKTESFNLLAA